MLGGAAAVPLVGLYVLARVATGWLATAAWIGFFAAVLGAIVIGVVTAVRVAADCEAPDDAIEPTRDPSRDP